MLVVGLTGGIASGKTTIARMFLQYCIPVFNADEAIHRLYRHDVVIRWVATQCPEAVVDGQVKRDILGKVAFHSPALLKQLEAFLHPLVQQEEAMFRKYYQLKGKRMVCCDIPLLFETGAQQRMDTTLLITAPLSIRYRRAHLRSGMTLKRFREICSKQMPDQEKRKYADSIIYNGLNLAFTRQQFDLWLHHHL